MTEPPFTERRQHDRRASDRRGELLQRLATVFLGMTLAAVILTGVLVLVRDDDVDKASTASKAALEQTDRLSRRTRGLAEKTRLASLASCRRGNETRPETIRTYLAIAEGNRSRAAAWAAIAAAFPPTAAVVSGQEDANLSEARALEASVRRIVEAQQEVSRHPRSPNPVKASKVDCISQFGRNASG